MSTTLQNFYKTTITRNWSATTGDFNVAVAPTISSGWLVISPNNSTLREIIYYTATGTNSYGAFVTVSTIGGRGVGGTTAQSHTIGESVRMNITAQHWAEMQSEIAGIIAAGAPNASTTVNGLVEEATDAEIIAQTTTGGTGAKLFAPIDKISGSKSITVSISSAEILALDNTVSKELVAAPGSGKIIIPEHVILSFTAGATPYAAGSTVVIQHDTGTHTMGYDAGWGSGVIDTGQITSATSTITYRGGYIQESFTGLDNKSLVLKLSGATKFTTGNGTIKVLLKYRIATL